MKITLFSFLLASFLCITNVSSQIDIKLSPVGLLFNSPDISAEYIVNEQIGLELLGGLDYGVIVGSGTISDLNRLDKSGYRIRFAGKYYFNKNKGADTWYAGLYLGTRTRTATPSVEASPTIGWTESFITTGMHGGYKFVLKSNIVIDFGLGFGRSFSERRNLNNRIFGSFLTRYGLNSFLKVEIGYRF